MFHLISSKNLQITSHLFLILFFHINLLRFSPNRLSSPVIKTKKNSICSVQLDTRAKIKSLTILKSCIYVSNYFTPLVNRDDWFPSYFENVTRFFRLEERSFLKKRAISHAVCFSRAEETSSVLSEACSQNARHGCSSIIALPYRRYHFRHLSLLPVFKDGYATFISLHAAIIQYRWFIEIFLR